jgi:hypothetical protein
MTDSSKNSDFKDKRLYPRFQLALQAAVVGRDSLEQESFIFMTENISLGGLQLRSNRDYPNLVAGMQLSLWIYLRHPSCPEFEQDRRVEVMAQVIRKIESSVFGMKITAISSVDRHALETFLNRVSQVEPHRIIRSRT